MSALFIFLKEIIYHIDDGLFKFRAKVAFSL